MLGKTLSGGLRDDVVILTKGCVPMQPGPNHKGLSASGVKATTEVVIPEEMMRKIDAIAPGPTKPLNRLNR